MTIFFQLVAERIEGINLKNEGNEALVAGRAIHELNGLKRNEMSECGSLPPTIGEMEWKQWTQRENFSFWVEFMRQWNGAPLAGGCLSFHLFVGYGPAAPLRSWTSFRSCSHLLHFVIFAFSSIAPAKTGSPKFISSLISEVKGREWFVCWPAAHNQLPSAASGMKKQTHSLQQIKICLREWRTATLPALSIQSPMKTKKV